MQTRGAAAGVMAGRAADVRRCPRICGTVHCALGGKSACCVAIVCAEKKPRSGRGLITRGRFSIEAECNPLPSGLG